MYALTKHNPPVLRRYNLATFSLGYLLGIVLCTLIGGITLAHVGQNLAVRFAGMADSVLSYAAVGWAFLTVVIAMSLLQRLELRAL